MTYIFIIYINRNLSRNELSGPIPAELGKLSNLETLYLLFIYFIIYN